jgi:hypothetical protein
MGGFFGGKSKSETDTHSTQTTTPWGKAVPGLDMLLSGITDSLSNPPQFYPGQTYLNLNGKQNLGLTDIWNNAQSAAGDIVNPAMDAFHQLLGGPNQNLWDDALGYYSDRAKTTNWIELSFLALMMQPLWQVDAPAAVRELLRVLLVLMLVGIFSDTIMTLL